MRKTHLGLYIHIPVCNVKCAYCDFYSLGAVPENRDFWRQYRDALYKELDHKLSHCKTEYYPGSIFFGGGTPSLAPPWFFKNLIQTILSHFPITQNSRLEISMEANPESLDNVSELIEAGINRITLGIQSTQEKFLNYLGRNASMVRHGKPSLLLIYVQAFEKLRRAGLKNYGADFICGIPGQKIKDLENDIAFARDQGARHISYYNLTIEKGTPLYRRIKQGESVASPSRQEFHLRKLPELAMKYGYRQYEVSNFSEPGYESLHNRGYWKHRPYLGLGPGAHSFLDPYRFSNRKDIQSYLKHPAESKEKELADAGAELFIGTLRLALHQGFSLFKRTLGEAGFALFMNTLDQARKDKMIKIEKSGFCILPDGLLFSDSLLDKFAQFLLSNKGNHS